MFDAGAVAALPDVLVRPDAFRTDRRPRLVATGYGGSIRRSFSGSSLFLAEAGIADGTLDGVFELYSEQKHDRGLQARGAAWKLHRALRRQHTGGFKFAPEFSAHLWRRHLPALAGTDVISNFQLFSEDFFRRRESVGVGAYFYLDGTLHDYLLGYRDFDVAGLDSATIARALEFERQGYHEADAVAVMSEFTAATLVSEYGLARDDIRVVLPGANLSDDMADRVATARAARTDSGEIIVGFVGVYPERKGLPKLAAAIAALRRDGVPVRLQVMGRCADEIAAMDGVDALGFISKTTQAHEFIAGLARIDLGCQLSTVEMFGIAVLEFLRCGIPVLATQVGGVIDIMPGGGGIAVPGDVPVEGVTAAIRRFVEEETYRQRLNAEAAGRSAAVRWQPAAQALGDMVAASGATR